MVNGLCALPSTVTVNYKLATQRQLFVNRIIQYVTYRSYQTYCNFDLWTQADIQTQQVSIWAKPAESLFPFGVGPYLAYHLWITSMYRYLSNQMYDRNLPHNNYNRIFNALLLIPGQALRSYFGVKFWGHAMRSTSGDILRVFFAISSTYSNGRSGGCGGCNQWLKR